MGALIIVHKRTGAGACKLRPRIHARLGFDEWYTLCDLAAARGVSPAVLVREALREYNARHAPPAPVPADEVRIEVHDGNVFKKLVHLFGNADKPTSS